MSKELPFIVLCIEEYKNAKGMKGKETLDLFNKYYSLVPQIINAFKNLSSAKEDLYARMFLDATN